MKDNCYSIIMIIFTWLPLLRGSVLGLRPPGLEFRILCLEDSVISIISPSSGGSPGPVVHKGGLKPDSCHFSFTFAEISLTVTFYIAGDFSSLTRAAFVATLFAATWSCVCHMWWACRFTWDQLIILYNPSIVLRLAGKLGDVIWIVKCFANAARFRRGWQKFQQWFVIIKLDESEFIAISQPSKLDYVFTRSYTSTVIAKWAPWHHQLSCYFRFLWSMMEAYCYIHDHQ